MTPVASALASLDAERRVDIDAGAAREEAKAAKGRRQLDLFGLDDCIGMCGA